MNLVPSVWIPYPRPSGTVELRCGVLYSTCQCIKRDGLQHDCPLSECQGRAACLTYPAPTCAPSGHPPKPIHSASEVQPYRYPVQSTDNYQRYKRKLNEKYRKMGKGGYVENPPVNLQQNVPCRVHKETLNSRKH